MDHVQRLHRGCSFQEPWSQGHRSLMWWQPEDLLVDTSGADSHQSEEGGLSGLVIPGATWSSWQVKLWGGRKVNKKVNITVVDVIIKTSLIQNPPQSHCKQLDLDYGDFRFFCWVLLFDAAFNNLKSRRGPWIVSFGEEINFSAFANGRISKSRSALLCHVATIMMSPLRDDLLNLTYIGSSTAPKLFLSRPTD